MCARVWLVLGEWGKGQGARARVSLRHISVCAPPPFSAFQAMLSACSQQNIAALLCPRWTCHCCNVLSWQGPLPDARAL